MFNLISTKAALSLIILIGLWSPSFVHAEGMVKRILTAKERGERIPNISKGAKVVDVAGAYQIQALVAQARIAEGDKIAGFKAGFTSSSAQAQYGVNRPAFSILFKSGDLSKNTIISLKNYNHLMVEAELGFIPYKPIKETINSVEKLKSYIGKIVPVVELPEMGFVQPPSAPDIIAGVGFGGYFWSGEINWINQDINKMAVSLFHNGNIINQGCGEDALGDQWEALRWLVNQVIAHGWIIEADQLLITGALGGMVPAVPGTFKAQFNDGATLQIKFVA